MPDLSIHRYSVPVDGEWHEFELTGHGVHVAARQPDVVEFWAYANLSPKVSVWLRVFGTGEPIPAGTGHVGTTLAADGRLVWHLVEMYAPYTDALKAAKEKTRA